MTPAIIIPARWGSTRLPGKPLRLVAGRPLLSRVIDLARRAVRKRPHVEIVVAADDDRVAALARGDGCAVLMTDIALSSGSARALAAARLLALPPSHIVNLQGDSALLPARAIEAVLDALSVGAPAATPAVQLTWAELDALRRHKHVSPFSGTTCIIGPNGNARWFSKAIIPALRNEERLRAAMPISPVYQHLGLYGYSWDALERFDAQPPGHFEELEGLEQLRLFDLGIPIRVVDAGPLAFVMNGIDTDEDLDRAEQFIATFGDPFGS